MKILFPANTGNIKYYNTHYMYLLNLLRYAGIEIEMFNAKYVSEVCFHIFVDGQRVWIDFSDHYHICHLYDQKEPYFKFHYSKQRNGELKNVYPIGPVSFYNWVVFYTLRSTFRYKVANQIICTNRPGGNAKERRQYVQDLLKKVYKSRAEINHRSPQTKFFDLIYNCMVLVSVPGARINILDRSHLQFMGFGCCTISPKIDATLAFGNDVIANQHYIECKDDFSDLVEKIDFCEKNKDVCLKIGNAAQKLFDRSCSPGYIVKWMKECLNA